MLGRGVLGLGGPRDGCFLFFVSARKLKYIIIWMGCVVFAAALLWGGRLLSAGHQSSSAVRRGWGGGGMRGGAVASGRLRGHPPDGASCSSMRVYSSVSHL